MYDIIILGGGAAGLFTSIFAPKESKKLIIEKESSLGKKVLLSGGERCNISNINIELEKDYFGKNKKFLHGFFHRFNNQDLIDWIECFGIKTNVEDRGRIILKSGNSRELLDLLIGESQRNSTEIIKNTKIESIEFIESKTNGKETENTDGYYLLKSENKEFKTKKLVVATGGKSFSQVGTTGDGYEIAKEFGLKMNDPFKGLCGITTKQDLAELSGTTVIADISIKDKNKQIYQEKGSFLFTHFGVSGPIIFNAVLAIGEYLRNNNIDGESEEQYIKDNITIGININPDQFTKKLRKFFERKNPTKQNNKSNTQQEEIIEDPIQVTYNIENLRSWKEAKVTGGGIDISELDNKCQSRKFPGLYFIGEVVDITGKTGGYNLQWAWSSAYTCAQSL